MHDSLLRIQAAETRRQDWLAEAERDSRIAQAAGTSSSVARPFSWVQAGHRTLYRLIRSLRDTTQTGSMPACPRRTVATAR